MGQGNYRQMAAMALCLSSSVCLASHEDEKQTVATYPIAITNAAFLLSSSPDAATPAALPLTPAPGAVKKSQWTLLMEDQRLDLAIKRWAQEEGINFRWDAERYFMIDAPTTFSGDFAFAVKTLLSSPGILNSGFPLEACLFANTPALLRVTRLGDQAVECVAK